MNELQQFLQFAVDVARQSGDIMRAYYNSPEKGIQTKLDKSPVTAADNQINQLLIDLVGQKYPDHGVLGEEASTLDGQRDVWVCDPIDGTAAFIFGLPTAMFSLAFVRDGEPLVGVAYDPFMDRMFTAIKGQPAVCNGQEIRVQATQTIVGAQIAGPSYVDGLLRSRNLYEDLSNQGASVPMFPGNVYKCTLLAEGRIHGRIFGGPGAHDIAAIKVIVEAAGGRVTDLDGNEQRYDRPLRGAVISNSTIHQDLLDAIQRFGGASKVMSV
jgi:fructose-1,6-bisphosphatase/inositol monophosphatase family enzyme